MRAREKVYRKEDFMGFDRRIVAASLAGLLLLPSTGFAQDAATTPAPAAAPTAPAATDASPAAAPAAPAAQAPAAAAPAAPAATAAPQVPDAVKAWAKFCDPDPKDQHKVCIVRKLVFKDASIVGSFVLRIDSKKGVPTLAIAALPTGIALRPGLKWQIDTSKAQVLPFWRCTPQSCESETLVKADFIGRLRKGKTLTFTAKNVENKDYVVTVDLAGFSAAYDNANAPTFKQYSESLPK
jgi:invasion protein IalB